MVSDRVKAMAAWGLLGVAFWGGPVLADDVAGSGASASSGGRAVHGASHGGSGPAHRVDNHLLIPLPADEVVGRQDVEYTCSLDEKKAGDDVRSLRMSLPADCFSVTYLSADIMALAVLPVDGRVMVFANVVAGDGAKYVGDRYSWWARGDQVTFAREDKEGVSFTCHVVPSVGKPADH
ncbi:MliC family protein [Bombella sp. TMW 2.2559]|uniref:MliC family protein n=1 Tax=Bombella dulcis TaxID=2967339 RepID=A0ABT3WCM2_9PROT|nr:MliC family protein [Bombella dulcis]MCX5616827.1 MliC family protein [Bombella dulcis]